MLINRKRISSGLENTKSSVAKLMADFRQTEEKEGRGKKILAKSPSKSRFPVCKRAKAPKREMLDISCR